MQVAGILCSEVESRRWNEKAGSSLVPLPRFLGQVCRRPVKAWATNSELLLGGGAGRGTLGRRERSPAGWSAPNAHATALLPLGEEQGPEGRRAGERLREGRGLGVPKLRSSRNFSRPRPASLKPGLLGLEGQERGCPRELK